MRNGQPAKTVELEDTLPWISDTEDKKLWQKMKTDHKPSGGTDFYEPDWNPDLSKARDGYVNYTPFRY